MIPIKNIWYMLAYAFQILKEDGMSNLDTENFKNTGDLFAQILIQGLTNQVRRGLKGQYREKEESLSTIRGRINLENTIRRSEFLKGKTVCRFEVFVPDSDQNRLYKLVIKILLKSDIDKERKRKLRYLLRYFEGVENVQIREIKWSNLDNERSRIGKILIGICRLLLEGLIQTDNNGQTRLMNFVDEQRMSRLYEKFLLEYCKREFPELNPRSARIKWALDDYEFSFLPNMQSDIFLENEEGKVLIIDAKYYGSNFLQHFSHQIIHPANIYQIFTYVKNEAAHRNNPQDVAGVLLYAKTDSQIQPKADYSMNGNVIKVRTLDLNQDFAKIKKDINSLVQTYFIGSTTH